MQEMSAVWVYRGSKIGILQFQAGKQIAFLKVSEATENLGFKLALNEKLV